jgi:hypothetical protein
MGSGKTTMMGEISDLLAIGCVAHAAIDVDAFGNAHDPAGVIDLAEVAFRNVTAAVRTYAAEGIATFVMAGAIESGAELARLREALAATDIVVCRLIAPVAVMQQRVRLREPGIWEQKYVDRVEVLEAALDQAKVEDFSVVNDGTRPVTAVAREILQRTGWLGS